MSYLYITEDGATVSVSGGYYVVNYKDGLVHKIPSETLESVSLFGNVTLTTPCVKKFLEKGVPVSYFSKNGAYFGRLESTRHCNIFRLKKQIYLSDDTGFSMALSKKIISAKITNQIVILRRYARLLKEIPRHISSEDNIRVYKLPLNGEVTAWGSKLTYEEEVIII